MPYYGSRLGEFLKPSLKEFPVTWGLPGSLSPLPRTMHLRGFRTGRFFPTEFHCNWTFTDGRPHPSSRHLHLLSLWGRGPGLGAHPCTESGACVQGVRKPSNPPSQDPILPDSQPQIR